MADKPLTTRPDEILALEEIHKIMSPFDARTQNRMINWLCQRLNSDNRKAEEVKAMAEANDEEKN